MSKIFLFEHYTSTFGGNMYKCSVQYLAISEECRANCKERNFILFCYGQMLDKGLKKICIKHW
jgi:hypothetical protein